MAVGAMYAYGIYCTVDSNRGRGCDVGIRCARETGAVYVMCVCMNLDTG